MKNRIAEIRKHENLTQDEFAKQLGLSRNYIWMIENGRRVPPDRTIADICRVFGVSELWLRTGEGEMTVQRTMNQELGVMINALMSESDESFRKRFVAALLELPEDAWPEIEKFAKKISQSE